jgi:predicted methyltransferase
VFAQPLENVMSVLTKFQGALLCLPLLGAALITTPVSASDLYDSAVHHAGRPAADLERDKLEHPAEVLRLAGIKPGMQVADICAFNGYYSELISYVVGPKGHVLMLNNAAYDHWSEGGWQKRLDNNHSLTNVEHRTIDLEHLDLPDNSVDALVLVKVYHDFYWVDPDPKTVWPKMDPQTVLTQLARVLKPGGIVLLEDHSAKPGTGSAAAGTLHRIDEAYTVQDWEKHGFKLVTKSDLLRRPDDKRELVSYTKPGVGKTDRFVLIFRKT